MGKNNIIKTVPLELCFEFLNVCLQWFKTQTNTYIIIVKERVLK